MVKANHLYGKAKSGSLTPPDLTDLFISSIFTAGQAHPPHPHAHVQHDGFTYGPNQEQLDLHQERGQILARHNGGGRATQQQRRVWNRRLGAIDRRRAKIAETRHNQGLEGTHIDPNLRGALHDPNTHLGDAYYQRPRHSMFENSETTLMALCYCLNSEAGKQALYGLSNGTFFSPPYHRAVIHSVSAVQGLNHHPQMDRLFERGPGHAGQAAGNRVQMARVVCVLSIDQYEFDLALTTLYPTSDLAVQNAPATQNPDTTDFVQFTRPRPPQGGFVPREWKSFPAKQPNQVSWMEPEPAGWAAMFGF